MAVVSVVANRCTVPQLVVIPFDEPYDVGTAAARIGLIQGTVLAKTECSLPTSGFAFPCHLYVLGRFILTVSTLFQRVTRFRHGQLPLVPQLIDALSSKVRCRWRIL
jgi:hypothetical protein